MRAAAAGLLVAGALSAGIYGLGFELFPGVDPCRSVGWLALPLFAISVGAAAVVWRTPGLPVWPILASAVLFRLLVMGDAPALSSDVYRYAWDGRVQRAGFSPYAHPPEADALAHLRDAEIHPNINRPWARTVYPPGGQALYLTLPYDVDAVRIAMVALDLLTMVLLVLLLRELGLDGARVVLYAWCPLVVYEVGNGGHLEAAVLPLLVGAVLAARRGRDGVGGLLLGGAVALKLYPLVALAALARRRPAAVVGAALVVPALLYAAYLPAAGVKVLGFLPEYVGIAEDHNIGLRAWLEVPLSAAGTPRPREVAFALCVGLLGVLLVGIWRSDAPLERRMMGVAGAYLLTLPTAFHPWYALWLVPWLCVQPRASWLWLVATLPLSYVKYDSPGGVMPGWVVPLELLPVFALLVVERRWQPLVAPRPVAALGGTT